MHTTKAILVGTRTLLSGPMCWTKGCRARTWIDHIISPYHSHAAKWSLDGAVERITRDLGLAGADAVCALLTLDDELITNTTDFNDHRQTTLEDVIKLLDRVLLEPEDENDTLFKDAQRH